MVVKLAAIAGEMVLWLEQTANPFGWSREEKQILSLLESTEIAVEAQNISALFKHTVAWNTCWYQQSILSIASWSTLVPQVLRCLSCLLLMVTDKSELSPPLLITTHWWKVITVRELHH